MTDFSSFGNSSVPWWNAFFTHSPTCAFTCTHTLTCFTLTEDLDSKKYRKDDCWLLERVQSKASRSNWGWMNSSALFGTYQKDWITPRNILSLIPAWLNHWDQVVRNLKLIKFHFESEGGVRMWAFSLCTYFRRFFRTFPTQWLPPCPSHFY